MMDGPLQTGSLKALFIASKKSVTPTIDTSVVSMNSPTKLLRIPGMTIVSACGRITSAIIPE